jgi:telomerase reverse transcriptase
MPPNLNPIAKMSLSDYNKRLGTLSEFVYYVFDSLLIPLIRSNFHVTETNIHRNRLFFFRHNVWRSLSEPALTTLKLSVFEEVKYTTAKRVLDRRSLGFSQVRILPKEAGVRPIVNLRRRVMRRHNGKVILGRSINSVMTPVFNVLNYEKVTSIRLTP